MTMHRGPIFIGGTDRCGKTTMRAFLVSHPNISIPAVGSNMWTYFYGQFGDLRQTGNFERCLQSMLRYKHVAFLQPNAERIRREFWQGEPTYARLFALFQRHHAEREGKPRWGDQTGLIERYADPIFAAYPGARMIHMLRDPRDRYEASLALWPNGKGRVGGATARWLYSAELAQRNLRRYPDRYLLIRYETMVAEPEATLRAVCAFLDEAYMPEMLTMDGAPERRARIIQGAPVDGSALLNPAFIGRYRQAIPPREIAFMQLHAGRAMRAHGYAPEPLAFTPAEWLRFALADWPLNLARMLSWRTMEAAQQHFPAWLGRKPGTKMIVGTGGPSTAESV
jgi:hypothetical protein